jgi:hypothetical protein
MGTQDDLHRSLGSRPLIHALLAQSIGMTLICLPLAIRRVNEKPHRALHDTRSESRESASRALGAYEQ